MNLSNFFYIWKQILKIIFENQFFGLIISILIIKTIIKLYNK